MWYDNPYKTQADDPKGKKMNTENLNIALLIDSDNIAPKYVETVFDELKTVGTVTVKRIYGDWTLEQSKSWKPILPKYALMPMQQYAYTSRKNSTDSAMIIDAMDILYLNAVDVFCLASSDSDFTRLAARLRESGKQVIGMGESKTPKAFVSACDSFRYLDVLSGEADAEPSDVTSITPRKEIEQEILSMLSQKEVGAKVQISVVKEALQRKYSDFDERNYGFSKFSGFLKSFKTLEVSPDGARHSLGVCLQYSARKAEIEAYVLSLLQRNRAHRLNIGEINSKITERFKDFSVKSMGYKQIKLFLSDIDGVEIENCDLVLK